MGKKNQNNQNRLEKLKEKVNALRQEVRGFGEDPEKGNTGAPHGSERDFRGIFENAPLGISYLDLKGRIEKTNQAFASMLGYTPEELTGITFDELTAKEDLPLSKRTFEELIEGNSAPRQIEKRYITREGRPLWVNASASLLEPEHEGESHVIVLVENIQARKMAEDKLEETLKEFSDFKYALDASSIVAITDAEGVIIYANDLFCRVSGYTREELIGAEHRIVNSGRHPRSFFKELWDTITAGEVWRGEVCNQAKDGTFYWVDTTIVPFLDSSDTPYQYIAIRKNITERKEAEEQLRTSEKRFRSIFENAAIGIGQVDHDGVVQKTNAKLREMLGYSEEFMRGIHFSDITHPDDLEKDNRLYAELMQGKRPSYQVEKRYIRQDGSILWGNVSVSLIRGKDDQPRYAIGLVEDITEKKEAEKALIRSEQRFRDVVEASGELVWESDTEYRFHYISSRVESILGFTREEIKGRTIFQFIPERERSRVLDRFDSIKTAGKSFRDFEIQMTSREGGIRWLKVSGTPYFDSRGVLKGYRGVAEDVTPEHEHMTQLRKAKKAAEIANRTKSEFLANVSHEIRTPLNSVLGFTNILAEIIADDQQQKYLEAISTSGQNLLNLLNDILDLSKIESGRLELEYNAVDLNQLFSEIQNIFSLKAEEQNLQLRSSIDHELPPALVLDEVRLRQVLINLVGNAIKFTDNGHVEVAITGHREGPEKSTYRLRFEVNDTGIGIPRDQQEHIFESFRQQSGQSNRKYGGTGLGLAISRRLVEKMGGEIGLRSTPGKGSTFYFDLPGVEISSIHPERHDLPEDFGNVVFETATVLVVDDVPLNNLLVREHLKRMGHKVLEASNGRQAVEMARAHLPDLILMDIKMPVMDGFEATRLIKNDPSTQHIPVIAHTASVLDSSAEQFSRLRFSGFLKKPLNKQELIDELKRFVPYHGAGNHSADSDKELDPEKWAATADAKLAGGDREALIDLLDGAWEAEWQRLRQTMVMGDAEKLARRMQQEGDRLGLSLLSDYGSRLKQKVDNFDIEELVKILALYPDVVKALKKVV